MQPKSQQREKLKWHNKYDGGEYSINIEEKKKFFKDFSCEVLTLNPANKKLISEFESKKANNSLVTYLKNEDKAWTEDGDGETRVYLVKDQSGKVALFFSIKCGLLVGRDSVEELTPIDKELFDLIVQAKKENNEESLKGYYDYGILEPDDIRNINELFRMADERLESKNEAAEIGQEGQTWNVPACFSGMELRHLCRNDNYQMPSEVDSRLGFGIFWEKIVPIVLEVATKVGCKYLYLFAADKTNNEENPNTKKLVSYYKNELKFHECGDELKFVKPKYDNTCYGLVQEISELRINRNIAWEEFSDVKKGRLDEQGLPFVLCWWLMKDIVIENVIPKTPFCDG